MSKIKYSFLFTLHQTMVALEYAPNGITIRATQPKEFYVGNQWHDLDGTRYYVPLTKQELKVCEDKEHCVTTFITNMNSMFYADTSFNQPIASWDTSRVADMGHMFYKATVFNQPIGAWDTSCVVSMRCMFFKASTFNQPIGEWDTSQVYDMFFMFSEATSFNQPIGCWDVSRVLTMKRILNGAFSFYQDLSGWNVRRGCDTTHWMKGTLMDYYQSRREDTLASTKQFKDELLAITWNRQLKYKE